MFILAWFVILILRANEVVIPHLVSFVVGALAIFEAVVYGIIILIYLLAIILAFKK